MDSSTKRNPSFLRLSINEITKYELRLMSAIGFDEFLRFETRKPVLTSALQGWEEFQLPRVETLGHCVVQIIRGKKAGFFQRLVACFSVWSVGPLVHFTFKWHEKRCTTANFWGQNENFHSTFAIVDDLSNLKHFRQWNCHWTNCISTS